MANNYLGIDYGSKRIGLSIGNDETKIAVVLKTVSNISEIIQTIADESIDVVVLGQPLSVVHASHTLPEAFQLFVKNLQQQLPKGIKLVFEDERLSSKYADALMGDKKTKASRDEIAALSILQNYLDKLN